jgi:hypothetical protein
LEIYVALAGFLLTVVLLMTFSFLVQAALKRREDISLLGWGQRQQKRNTRVLWGLILLAIAYISLLRYLHTLTGMSMLDGSIGLALGLYICSHPAANAVNMLFFERGTLRQSASGTSIVRWLALNLLVLLAGWMVVFIGITRLVDRTT